MTVGILDFPKDNIDLRYLFFDFDRQDKYIAFDIMQVYNRHGLSCYAHKTMKGYHFINLLPLPKKEHAMILRELRILCDAICPHNTLRVKTNKWKNEIELWKTGVIIRSPSDTHTDRLILLKKLIEEQNIAEIMKQFNYTMYKLIVTEEEKAMGLL
jgi:hypothetical protein